MKSFVALPRALHFSMISTFLLILFLCPLSNAREWKQRLNPALCPRVLDINIDNLKVSPPPNNPEASNLVRELTSDTKLYIKMDLHFAGSEKCYYEGRNLNGTYFWSVLKNIRDENSGHPYRLSLESKNLKTSLPVESFHNGALNFSYEVIELHYQSKIKSKNIVSIGSGEITPIDFSKNF